jgi:hypothetical protein
LDERNRVRPGINPIGMNSGQNTTFQESRSDQKKLFDQGYSTIQAAARRCQTLLITFQR